jgi:hypothetical protein
MNTHNIIQEIEAINHEIVHAANEHNAAGILRFIEPSEDLHVVEHTHVTIGWNALRKGFEEWFVTHQNWSLTPQYSYVNVLTPDIAVFVASGVWNRDNIPFQNHTLTAVFQKKMVHGRSSMPMNHFQVLRVKLAEL